MDNQGKQTGAGFLYHFTTVLMEVIGCLTSLPGHGNYDVPDNYQRIAIFLCELGVIIKKKQGEYASRGTSNVYHFRLDECVKLLGYISEVCVRVSPRMPIDPLISVITALKKNGGAWTKLWRWWKFWNHLSHDPSKKLRLKSYHAFHNQCY